MNVVEVTKEAIVVGIMIAVGGAAFDASNFGVHPFVKYFLVGVLMHFVSELVGFNAWYCRGGHACKSN